MKYEILSPHMKTQKGDIVIGLNPIELAINSKLKIIVTKHSHNIRTFQHPSEVWDGEKGYRKITEQNNGQQNGTTQKKEERTR